MEDFFHIKFCGYDDAADTRWAPQSEMDAPDAVREYWSYYNREGYKHYKKNVALTRAIGNHHAS